MEHRSFADDERREIVTQAIKTSNIPLEKLVQLFDEHGAEPDWPKMELPWRRNQETCKTWFDQFRRDNAYPPRARYSPQYSPYPRQDTPSNPNKRKSTDLLDPVPGGMGGPAKRRSGGGSGMGAVEKLAQHSHILPKPASTSASPLVSTFPPPSTAPSAIPSSKRRGRPPKAVVEERQRQQVERGEIIAPMPLGNMITPVAQSPQRERYDAVHGFAPIAPAVPPRQSSASPRRIGYQDSSSASGARNVAKSPKVQRVSSDRRLADGGLTSKQRDQQRPGEYNFPLNPQLPRPRDTYSPPPRDIMAGPMASTSSSNPAANLNPDRTEDILFKSLDQRPQPPPPHSRPPDH